MSKKNTPQSVIDSYQRKQKMMPAIVLGTAILLVVVGIIILVIWLSGSNGPLSGIFASATPTASNTPTVTPVTPTNTPTITPTPSVTPTLASPTPTGPEVYTVELNDTCWDIAVKKEVDVNDLLKLNGFAAGTCPISPGQKILIPNKDTVLPTNTPQPMPTDIGQYPRGTLWTYTIEPNDTLESIAAKFNSTVEAIMAIRENNITDKTLIFAGQVIKVPMNLITPTPTSAPTLTPGTPQPTITLSNPGATATKSP